MRIKTHRKNSLYTELYLVVNLEENTKLNEYKIYSLCFVRLRKL